MVDLRERSTWRWRWLRGVALALGMALATAETRVGGDALHVGAEVPAAAVASTVPGAVVSARSDEEMISAAVATATQDKASGFTAADTLPEAMEMEDGEEEEPLGEMPVVALLTDEQLRAIGVPEDDDDGQTEPKDSEKTGNDDETMATKDTANTQPERAVDAEAPPVDGDHDGEADALTVQSARAKPTAPKHDLSLDQVEAHLQILQELELSVARSIDALNAHANQRSPRADDQLRHSSDMSRLHLELQAVQSNLNQLARGLNGTLQDLEVVEKDTEQKSKQLEEVLHHREEEQAEQFIAANGIKVVDYETGRFRASSNLTSLHRTKREAAEKQVDPAVLHYDFKLLGQIAILLGVSAIGGILATYFNIPPHIGYLLGGVLVGPSCLMVVQQYKEVETLSLFGSIFLLFGHGAGYTPQSPDHRWKTYFVGGLAYIIAVVSLVAVVSDYLGWSATFSGGLTMGVAVCFTTTAPISEHIRVNQIQDTSYGRALIAIIAMQDVLMSFALGTPEWFSGRSAGWIGVAVIRSVLSYAIVVVLALGLHLHVVPPLLRFLTAKEQLHHSPLVLLGVVSVCLFMALFTEIIGLSLECGAFLAGLAFVHASRDAQTAFTSIRVMENLFGSMFFACVGMILNPLFLLKNAGEILSMVILIIVIKTCTMTVVMTFFKVPLEKALLAGVGLCQIGELALIFMIKAHATELISRRMYLLFVAAIAVFLGCSSIFNRQVVLARRKNVFRLPTMVRRHHKRGGSGLDKRHASVSRRHYDEDDDDEDDANELLSRNGRADSGSDAILSPPGTPRERRAIGNTISLH